MGSLRTVYKVTDENNKTRGGMEWGENVTHTATGTGGLCTSGVIHSYASPELAAFMMPIHVSFKEPRLWAATAEVLFDDGTKLGSRSLATLHEISLPTPYLKQRRVFAILCAEAALASVNFKNSYYCDKISKWRVWAERALSGAKPGCPCVGYADARAAAYAAARAAAVARSADDAAAYAARAARAAAVARSADAAADAAAYAAARAAAVATIDIAALASKAMNWRD